jgi:hypothetical protein
MLDFQPIWLIWIFGQSILLSGSLLNPFHSHLFSICHVIISFVIIFIWFIKKVHLTFIDINSRYFIIHLLVIYNGLIQLFKDVLSVLFHFVLRQSISYFILRHWIGDDVLFETLHFCKSRDTV